MSNDVLAMRSDRPIEFFKLEALRNDFVLIDARKEATPLLDAESNSEWIRRLADRRVGVGCDQLLILEPPTSDCFARVRIFNADGSAAEQCGNGMRAIAAWAQQQQWLGNGLCLSTDAGPVTIERNGKAYQADLPAPRRLTPEELKLPPPQLPDFCSEATLWSLGNPHLVARTHESPNDTLLEQLVEMLERQAEWHQRVNIGLARIQPGAAIELRVHERGSGPTPACGSGACAAAASAITLGGTPGPLRVDQPGGSLMIDWRPEDAQVRTTGPARVVFRGTINSTAETAE